MTAKKEPAEKSAAEQLLELQLKRELEAQRNPLQVVDVKVVEKGPFNSTGARLVKTVRYANGSVVRNFA